MTEPRHRELTAREREVLACLAAGMSDKQVARSLGISIRTVNAHVSNLLRKTRLSRAPRRRCGRSGTWRPARPRPPEPPRGRIGAVQVPSDLREALDRATAGDAGPRLAAAVDTLIGALPFRRTAAAAPILTGAVDVTAYAAYRMPATYAAVRAALAQVAGRVPGLAPSEPARPRRRDRRRRLGGGRRVPRPGLGHRGRPGAGGPRAGRAAGPHGAAGRRCGRPPGATPSSVASTPAAPTW